MEIKKRVFNMRTKKKEDLSIRLDKIKKDYKKWKKEQKMRKISLPEVDLPAEYQPYEDVTREVEDDGLQWYCYLILFSFLFITGTVLILSFI